MNQLIAGWLSCVGLSAIVFFVRVIVRKDLSISMQRFRAPGTFNVHNRHHGAIVGFVHADETLTGQPFTREATEDAHRYYLDCRNAQDV